MNLSFAEMLRYTQEERDKWRGFLESRDVDVPVPDAAAHRWVEDVNSVGHRHCDVLVHAPGGAAGVAVDQHVLGRVLEGPRAPRLRDAEPALAGRQAAPFLVGRPHGTRE